MANERGHNWRLWIEAIVNAVDAESQQEAIMGAAEVLEKSPMAKLEWRDWVILRKIVVGALRHDSELRDEGIRRAHEAVLTRGVAMGRHNRCGGLGMVIDQFGRTVPCGCTPDRTEGGQCPDCAESGVDYLTWVGDDTIRCTTCGKEYRP